MSAIFGIYYLDGKPVESRLLDAMSKTLAHRGSDSSGIWTEGSVGLGHRMLWTTPESLTEKLPKSILDGDLVITADARIDNREALFAELAISSDRSRYISDSEIILLAYEKWGEGCTSKLLGDFAFAIWDKRRHHVFCVRDHFGVKPLYYYSSENIFVFASEIKALWCVKGIPKKVNELKVSDHLEGCFDDVTSTFYKGICKLPARNQMIVSRQSKRTETYWDFDSTRETRFKSNKEYSERFIEIFAEAVRCRTRSAFTVGSMLSGGLDSTSIACMARTFAPNGENESVPTFSAVFNTVKESDEQPFINAALSQGGLDPHFLHADQVSPLADWERVLWHQDDVLYSFNLYLNWGIYKLAEKRGVRVMLDGYDGDTAVSHGTVRLDELAIQRRWLTLAKEIARYAKSVDRKPYQLMWAYFNIYRVRPLIKTTPPLRYLQQKGKGVMRRTWPKRPPTASALTLDDILNPQFVERNDLEGRRQTYKNIRGKRPNVEKEHHLYQLNWGVMQYILEVLDKSAAAFGIELRYPFWDRRLIEFCLSLPADQKLQNGWTRFILRNSMSGVLPKAVQWRGGKSNLGHAFRHGFLDYESQTIEHALGDEQGRLSQFIDVRKLRESFLTFKSGIVPTDEELMLIWKTTTLALWLENADF